MTTLDLFADTSSGAVISDDQVYRYLLERRVPRVVKEDDGVRLSTVICDDLGLGWLGFIMLNPSTADWFKNDQTIGKCMGFAQRLGYGGIRVANLYAYRTRHPKILAQAHKDGIDIVGPENERWLRHVLTNCQKVVVAWGMQGPRRERIGRLVALADEINVKLHAIGVNQDGNPRHPLMTPYATPMTEWRPAA